MNKKKKILLLILSLTLVSLVTLMTYLHFTTTEDLVFKKEITLTFRQKIKNSDLIEKINGKLLLDPYVDTNVVGKRKVQVTYYNHYGFIENKSVEVTIKDITPPTVVVNKVLSLEVGSTTNLLDNIFCADDYDDKVTCQIEGDYQLNKVGKYNLKITAKDHSNNITSKAFTLKITEKEKTATPPKETKTDFKEVYQKYKTKNTLIGIDISKWQEEIDFSKIKEQGVEFVMIKIGGQSQKGGKIELDPKFSQNITNALAHNLKVGIYFYSHATNTKEAQKQAEWIIKKVKDYQLDLPIALDWENWSKYTSYHLSFHTLNNIANAFFTTLEENNYQTLLYSSKYYLENIWYEEEYNNWIAHYTTNSTNKEKYTMWQLCSDGKIDGIDSFVDIDVLFQKDK